MGAFRKFVAAVLLVPLVVVGLAWLYLFDSLPKLHGEVAVEPATGLGQAVEILRDREGVPHIFAQSEMDGWYAMGYVHAQDRLWQMEFQRRVALGRLAQVMGEPAYDNDRLMRTLGIGEAARRMVANADDPSRMGLEAYAAGVNAYIRSARTLPVEFLVFDIKPEPWKPEHSAAWMLVMAWDLSANWRTELGRLRFMAKVGRDRTNELIPPYPGDVAGPLPDYSALYKSIAPAAGALLEISPPTGEAVGSNSWVVSGARSETGKPILANDPHLGLQAPALWYLAHVSQPQGNVVGGTLPGLPFVVLGRTDQVAWSMTTTLGDTQDLFVERVDPKDASSYLTPKGSEKFGVRDEVIWVKEEQRRITVRTTRHGPVLSDVSKPLTGVTPAGHVIALAWAALDPRNQSVDAGFEMNRARNARELLEAARKFHAPHQNVVYADREGRVGFVAPSLVPIRRADNEAMGRVPVPGWIAKYDWQGYLPFEQLPAVTDPKTGRIVTANHKITPPGYKPFLSVDWYAPFRADRIEELLATRPKHSVASFRRIQADTVSRMATLMLPVARAAKPAGEAGKRAQAMLAGWNGDMTVEAAAPLVFSSWYRELTRLVLKDELGATLFRETWEQRGTFMLAVMRGERGMERWCDDVTTPARETCAGLAAEAFERAHADLEVRYGDAAKWRWGHAHKAMGAHRPFGFVPYARALFDIEPETPGDGYTVNVGATTLRNEERPYGNRHAASLRAIYDLANPDKSLFMQSTGQSGNILSSWYASFAQRWAQVEYITIPTKRDAIDAPERLVITPGAP